ncbi:MAG: hypothetical protein QOE82_2361 [Thermoanaerobaculia bacterium]|jgi:hypothetical protein|nr:hypothetical protein [Thermoanaerobaculia bacterium]
MNLPFLGRAIDERFLNRRQKSTSAAGVIGGVSATLLFAWRFYINHIWSWDILAIALIIVGVKMAMMAWYFFTD